MSTAITKPVDPMPVRPQAQTAMKRFEAGPILSAIPGVKEVEVLKRGPDGSIRQIRARMQLTAAQKDLWSMPGSTDPELSASAYYRMNQVYGAVPMTPPRILVDGRMVENPYIRHHEASGAVLWTVYEAVWIGRNAVGNITVSRIRMHFDPRLYRTQALLKAWRGKPGKPGYSFRDKATGEMKEVAAKKGTGNATWGQLVATKHAASLDGPTKRLFHISEEDTLVVDIEAPEVAQIIETYSQLQQFADKRAITMADRNALKKMMGIFKCAPDGTVSVIGWSESDAALQQFVDVATSRVDLSIDRVAASVGATIENEELVPSPEDLAAAGGEYEEGSVITEPEPEELAATDPAAAECESLREKIRKYWVAANPAKLAAALKENGIDKPPVQIKAELDNYTDPASLALVLEAVNKASRKGA